MTLYWKAISLNISLQIQEAHKSYLFNLYQPISPIEIKDVFIRRDLAEREQHYGNNSTLVGICEVFFTFF